MKLIAHHLHAAEPQTSGRLSITNDVDPRGLALSGLTRIDLCFPKFTDGRAYSQAYLLRRRLGFVGELRATGDVLLDQLLLMQRNGFDSAVLRADQDSGAASGQLGYFPDFYQADARGCMPRFALPAQQHGA